MVLVQGGRRFVTCSEEEAEGVSTRQLCYKELAGWAFIVIWGSLREEGLTLKGVLGMTGESDKSYHSGEEIEPRVHL